MKKERFFRSSDLRNENPIENSLNTGTFFSTQLSSNTYHQNSLGQLKQVFNLTIKSFCNFQCQDRGGYVNTIFNSIDTFSGDFCRNGQILLSQTSRFSQFFQVIQEFFMILSQNYFFSNSSTALVSSLPVFG